MTLEMIAGPATDLVIQPRGIERLGGVLDIKDSPSLPAALVRPQIFAGNDELPTGWLDRQPKIVIRRGCNGEFVCQLVSRIRAYEPVRFRCRDQAIKAAAPVAKRLRARLVGKGIKRCLNGGAQ